MAGKFEISKRSNGEYQFNLKAGNGQVIGKSEMYSGDAARDNGIRSVMENAPGASVADIIAPTLVVDPRTGQQIAHPIRTSDGAVIGPTRENLVIQDIQQRIAEASGTDRLSGEPIHILRYRPGQQYRPHFDALNGAANQRILTAILYLNDGFSGGETEFPQIGVRIRAEKGGLLLFSKCLADGDIDRRALHAGLPVTHGEKWIATRWIRQQRYDPWNPS